MQELLDDNKVLLIDVRNRTELNDVGQIPGSVCLPLHEVRLAFQLSPEEFEVSYIQMKYEYDGWLKSRLVDGHSDFLNGKIFNPKQS